MRPRPGRVGSWVWIQRSNDCSPMCCTILVLHRTTACQQTASHRADGSGYGIRRPHQGDRSSARRIASIQCLHSMCVRSVWSGGRLMSTMSTRLGIEDDGLGVRTLTLNRPERLNAIDMAMILELETALVAALEDAAVGAILLRGAGRSFCAGDDVAAQAEICAGG